jgi:hypothetical protein
MVYSKEVIQMTTNKQELVAKAVAETEQKDDNTVYMDLFDVHKEPVQKEVPKELDPKRLSGVTLEVVSIKSVANSFEYSDRDTTMYLRRYCANPAGTCLNKGRNSCRGCHLYREAEITKEDTVKVTG